MNKIKVGNIPINGFFIYHTELWRSDGKMTIGSDDISAFNRYGRGIVLPYDTKVIQYKGKDEQDEDYMRVLAKVSERKLQDVLVELDFPRINIYTTEDGEVRYG